MKKVLFSLFIAMIAATTIHAGIREEICPKLKVRMTLSEVIDTLKLQGYNKVTEDDYLGMNHISFVNWDTYKAWSLSFVDGKLAEIYIGTDKEKNLKTEKRLIEEYKLKPERKWAKYTKLGYTYAKFYILTEVHEAWAFLEEPTGYSILILNEEGLLREESQYTPQ